MSNPALKKNQTYDYGDTFNYAQWTENTQLTLVNINWNSDYRDIVRFSNQNALDTWIDSQPKHVIEKMSLLKFGQNVRVNTPLNTAMQYNYARASNPTMPVTGDTQRNYYYFVQEYRYINPNTTELILQLDVWQTFGYEVTFGKCFIERGHIGIANENAFNDYGRDYLSIAEGLDVGGEYRTARVDQTILISPYVESGYEVLVCSTTELAAPTGNFSDPALYTAWGTVFEGLPSGASFYIFKTGQDFADFMKRYAGYPWVTEGIISVTLIPPIRRYHPDYNYGTSLAPNNTDATNNDPIPPFYAVPADRPTVSIGPTQPDWRNNAWVTRMLGQYGILKKFLTYPYTVIELTTFTGSPVILKPEMWQDPDASLGEMAALVPPGQRIVIYPKRYNADAETANHTQGGTNDNADDFGDFINIGVALDNFPSLPVVNNMAISYLASNKNGLAFEFRSADWSQQKALRGAEATNSIANSEIANTGRQAGIANRAAMTIAEMQASTLMNNTALGLGSTAIAGLAGTAAMGLAGSMGPAGALSAPGQAANSAMLTTDSAVTSNAARGDSAVSGIQTMGQIRDTNVGLARFAARGDYHNAIAGINAKIQDSKMIQPSTSGQFGGDAFNIINGLFGYSLRWKMLSTNAMKTIGNYWLRYGYAVQQFANVPSDFMCMEKFTYWKLTETYISQAPIPEMFKQTIRGIFEKGVTVWADPSYIGNTSLFDNAPKTGISY